MSPYSLFDVSLSLLFRCFVLFVFSLCACAVAISTTEYESVLRVLKQWSADRLRALYYDVIITSMTHCLQCIENFVKSAQWLKEKDFWSQRFEHHSRDEISERERKKTSTTPEIQLNKFESGLFGGK